MEHLRISPQPHYGGDSLEEYADEVRASLNSALRIVEKATSVTAARFPDQPVTQKEVRALQKLRRSRNRFFDGDMFADPAWDILLELYAAKLGQQKVAVGHLCEAAGVPATTALRWISMLQNKGLIERTADPMDGRRFHLSLSSAGLCTMGSYFRTVPVGAALV